MKLPSFLASDNALEGFLKGFFAPVYLLMSLFEKKEPEVKAQPINIKVQIITFEKEKAENLFLVKRLIKISEGNYNYLTLLASRLYDAINDDQAFEFRKVLSQMRAHCTSALPNELITLISNLDNYSPIIDKLQPKKRIYANTHLQAMQNVMAFHADSFKPYKKLVDAHEKAK